VEDEEWADRGRYREKDSAITSREEASRDYCEAAGSFEGLQWKFRGRIGHEINLSSHERLP
jgi:hypothetical protein